jgi:hypothetical protein
MCEYGVFVGFTGQCAFACSSPRNAIGYIDI